MKLIKVTSQMRNDFYGDFECEHCFSIREIRGCYDDVFFHNRVIPSFYCKECGKNRAGNTEIYIIIDNPCGTLTDKKFKIIHNVFKKYQDAIDMIKSLEGCEGNFQLLTLEVIE